MSQPNHPDFDSLWDYSNPKTTETKFRGLLPQLEMGTSARLELLTQIARTQGLQHMFDEAHHTLDEVERDLEETDSRAKVRYLLERGRVFNSSGKAGEARPFFDEAFDMAKRLGEDFYAVDAIHMLAIVSEPASALTLNLQAIQLAESSGQEKARNWLGSLYNNTGWAYHDIGDYESALEIFQKAESFFRSKGGEEKIRIAVWTVARCLRSLNRIEEALSKQKALKDELESAGESDGYVYEEIGECLLALKRDDEAKLYFSKAYEILSADEWLAEKEPERLNRLKELSG